MASSADAPGETDQLQSINDELRHQAGKDSPWLPLESNPELFTQFGHSVGLPKDWGWFDVFGLEEPLLAMVPQPCAAVILLFPCTPNIYEARRREAALLRKKQMPTEAFFLKQHAQFGNACGTIASVHALSNSSWAFGGSGGSSGGDTGGGSLAAFCAKHRQDGPDERGRALLRAPELKFASDVAASGEAAQTALPSRTGPALDHHFCAFVLGLSASGEPGEGGARLLELDGTKAAPVDHGPVGEGEGGGGAPSVTAVFESNPRAVLDAAARVVRERFMQVDPENIEFTLMALCKKPPEDA